FGKNDPTNAEWQSLLTEVRKNEDSSPYRVLIYSDGGGPSSLQRAQLSEAFAGRPPLMALLTDNFLAHGIGVAMRWFNPRFRIVGSRAFAEAFRHLDVNEADIKQLQSLLRNVAAQENVTLPPLG